MALWPQLLCQGGKHTTIRTVLLPVPDVCACVFTHPAPPPCRYNVKRRLDKKPPVTEAAFEAMIEQQDDVSLGRGFGG